MNKKTLRKIKKLKQNEELTINTDGGETVNIICLEKGQYLLFTPDSFYEMNYDEILQKYR